MKFAIAARDPQVDLYHEDDFYGLEVVESDSEDEARNNSQWFGIDGLQGLQTWVYQVADDTEIGWHDELLPCITPGSS